MVSIVAQGAVISIAKRRQGANERRHNLLPVISKLAIDRSAIAPIDCQWLRIPQGSPQQEEAYGARPKLRDCWRRNEQQVRRMHGVGTHVGGVCWSCESVCIRRVSVRSLCPMIDAWI